MANRPRKRLGKAKRHRSSVSRVRRPTNELELKAASHTGGESAEERIQRFFYVEDLLYDFVGKANQGLRGDGCSIFLWDTDAERYVLRASTVMTPFIGMYALDHTRNVELDRCGITTRVVVRGEPYLAEDVRDCRFWTEYHRDSKRSRQASKTEHCEVDRKELLSLIAVPLPAQQHYHNLPLGVVRVVKKRDTKEPFRENDRDTLSNLVANYSTSISGALSLGKLIEIGSILHEEELCQKAVELLAEMVQGKGCSIFLLDQDSSQEDRSIYSCVATTGLAKHTGNGVYEAIEDHKSALYEIPEDYDAGHLTAYVIRHKRNIVIKDLRDLDSSDFRKEFGISRPRGVGKFSEIHYTKPVEGKGTGPFMATPILFRERFYPQMRAAGVIRLTRQQGGDGFDPFEQRRFFSFAEELSNAILHCRYIALMNKLSPAKPEEELYENVVAEVPQLIGRQGCSVFVSAADPPKLEMKATSGRLKQLLTRGEIQPYDLDDENNRGYTGAVVFFNRAICFNDDKEKAKLPKRFKPSLSRVLKKGRKIQ